MGQHRCHEGLADLQSSAAAGEVQVSLEASSGQNEAETWKSVVLVANFSTEEEVEELLHNWDTQNQQVLVDVVGITGKMS